LMSGFVFLLIVFPMYNAHHCRGGLVYTSRPEQETEITVVSYGEETTLQ
jgi:hypothetical protein